MRNLSKLIVSFAGIFVVAFPVSDAARQAESRVRLTENSDWFSDLRTIENEEVGETQKREVPDSNFEIAGIKLGEDFFKQATKKLGRTTVGGTR